MVIYLNNYLLTLNGVRKTLNIRIADRLIQPLTELQCLRVQRTGVSGRTHWQTEYTSRKCILTIYSFHDITQSRLTMLRL